MSTSYPHFHWPARLEDIFSYITNDGEPIMDYDLIYVELSENDSLDLDWVPSLNPKGNYRLRIFDSEFLDVKYEFTHKDPTIITKEIERIVGEYTSRDD